MDTWQHGSTSDEAIQPPGNAAVAAALAPAGAQSATGPAAAAATLQSPRAHPIQLQAPLQFAIPSGMPSSSLGLDAFLPPPAGVAGTATLSTSPLRAAMPPLNTHKRQGQPTNFLPPPGCEPDAIKLFVGNIPKHYTEEQLKPFFETVGPVVELVIMRDKISHESKGSAFVWYTSRQNAEVAMQRFNLSHVLPDPSGRQVRPLVVRPANVRAAGGSAGAQSAGGRRQQQAPHAATAAAAPFPRSLQAPLFQQQAAPASMQQRFAPVGVPMGPQYPYQPQMIAPGAPLVYQPVAPSQQVTLNLQLMNQQMAVVGEHLYNVQTMCGAQISTAPLANGLSSVLIAGSEQQVEHARQLISGLLSQTGYSG